MSDIKLYHLSAQSVSEINSTTMALEKPLQTLFRA